MARPIHWAGSTPYNDKIYFLHLTCRTWTAALPLHHSHTFFMQFCPLIWKLLSIGFHSRLLCVYCVWGGSGLPEDVTDDLFLRWWDPSTVMLKNKLLLQIYCLLVQDIIICMLSKKKLKPHYATPSKEKYLNDQRLKPTNKHKTTGWGLTFILLYLINPTIISELCMCSYNRKWPLYNVVPLKKSKIYLLSNRFVISAFLQRQKKEQLHFFTLRLQSPLKVPGLHSASVSANVFCTV